MTMNMKWQLSKLALAVIVSVVWWGWQKGFFP